jgi:hypothetical protein
VKKHAFNKKQDAKKLIQGLEQAHKEAASSVLSRL